MDGELCLRYIGLMANQNRDSFLCGEGHNRRIIQKDETLIRKDKKHVF